MSFLFENTFIELASLISSNILFHIFEASFTRAASLISKRSAEDLSVHRSIDGFFISLSFI